jgi:5-azacytidine-induced protein 1
MSSRAASIIQMLGDDVQESAPLEGNSMEMRSKVAALETERAEMFKTVESLKLLSERLRQDMKNQEEDFNRRLERALARQKDEFEDIVGKNINFTEGLLVEKEQKNKLLTDLQRKLKETEMRAELQVEEIRAAQAKELKKNKDAWATAEKLRRDAWEKQRTKEIRDQTARGLEPELVRLMNEHSQKVDQLKEEHRQALSRQRTELTLEFEENLRKMKENWGRDLDQQLEKEREMYSKRIREQMDKHEAEIQTLRRRGLEEAGDLRKRLEIDRESDTKAANSKVRSIEEEMRRREKAHESDMLELREELGRRHNGEIQRLKEQQGVEKEAWIEAQLARNQKDLETAKKQIRAEMVRQRDSEIASIIQKLGSEHLDTKKLLEQQLDKQISALKSQQSNELSQYQVMVDSLRQKVESEASGKRVLLENLETLGRRLQDMETQAKGSDNREADLLRKLQDKEAALKRAELDKEAAVAMAIDQQRIRTSKAEMELNEVKSRLEVLSAHHEREIEQIKQQEAEEMETLGEQVKAGMRKKDEAIRKLKEDLQVSQVKVGKLEEMLERQRASMLQK